MSSLGVILAGGASRRFGRDKALATWRGKSLITHSADALQPFVESIVVAGRACRAAGLTTIPDYPRPGLGPLGGIAGALRLAETMGYKGVLSIACDMPLVPAGILAKLASAERPTYVTQAPVLAYWPTILFPRLIEFLSLSPDHAITHWAVYSGAGALRHDEPMPNINRQEDLNRLPR